MSPTLRKSVLAAVGGGAFAIASALITGPTGNDGLEGVRYDPYQDVVGVWTVCYSTQVKTSCSAKPIPRQSVGRY